MTTNVFRVVHLVRSVGPTSMPWNDLYGTARAMYPGVMHSMIAIGGSVGRPSWHWEGEGDGKRKYLRVNPLCALGLLRRISKSQAGQGAIVVVHIHNPSLGPLAALLRMVCPSIVIVSNLHSHWNYYRVWQRLGLRLAVRRSAMLICVSDAARDTVPGAVRRRLTKRGALRVIRNGIRSGDLEKNYPLETLGSERRPDVIVVARMVPAKNASFVLRCFAKMRFARKLVWFGDGAERLRLEELAKRLGVEERIEFKGLRPRPEVMAGLATGSVYMSCSKWEGIGVANLEAGALGCQPFLSDIPAHREIAAALDIETISLDGEERWVTLIDDHLRMSEEERSAHALDIARKARNGFDLEICVRDYMKMYEEVSA